MHIKSFKTLLWSISLIPVVYALAQALGSLPPPQPPSNFTVTVNDGLAAARWTPESVGAMYLELDGAPAGNAPADAGSLVIGFTDVGQPHRFTLIHTGVPGGNSEPAIFDYIPATTAQVCDFYASAFAEVQSSTWGVVHVASYWTGKVTKNIDGSKSYEQANGYGVHGYQTPSLGDPRTHGTRDAWWNFSGATQPTGLTSINTTSVKKAWADDYAGIQSMGLGGAANSPVFLINGAMAPNGRVTDYSINCK